MDNENEIITNYDEINYTKFAKVTEKLESVYGEGNVKFEYLNIDGSTATEEAEYISVKINITQNQFKNFCQNKIEEESRQLITDILPNGILKLGELVNSELEEMVQNKIEDMETFPIQFRTIMDKDGVAAYELEDSFLNVYNISKTLSNPEELKYRDTREPRLEPLEYLVDKTKMLNNISDFAGIYFGADFIQSGLISDNVIEEHRSALLQNTITKSKLIDINQLISNINTMKEDGIIQGDYRLKLEDFGLDNSTFKDKMSLSAKGNVIASSYVEFSLKVWDKFQENLNWIKLRDELANSSANNEYAGFSFKQQIDEMLEKNIKTPYNTLLNSIGSHINYSISNTIKIFKENKASGNQADEINKTINREFKKIFNCIDFTNEQKIDLIGSLKETFAYSNFENQLFKAVIADLNVFDLEQIKELNKITPQALGNLDSYLQKQMDNSVFISMSDIINLESNLSDAFIREEIGLRLDDKDIFTKNLNSRISGLLSIDKEQAENCFSNINSFYVLVEEIKDGKGLNTNEAIKDIINTAMQVEMSADSTTKDGINLLSAIHYARANVKNQEDSIYFDGLIDSIREKDGFDIRYMDFDDILLIGERISHNKPREFSNFIEFLANQVPDTKEQIFKDMDYHEYVSKKIDDLNNKSRVKDDLAIFNFSVANNKYPTAEIHTSLKTIQGSDLKIRCNIAQELFIKSDSTACFDDLTLEQRIKILDSQVFVKAGSQKLGIEEFTSKFLSPSHKELLEMVKTEKKQYELNSVLKQASKISSQKI